ncbi:MAG TPA: hypothetical protein VGQ00_02015 [Candidatus Norongarragalinales archaeon]|jgi:hypothetical protein|nr:hypothetical protein [Candidatus Norongarragalinales archaeon]
MHQRIRAQGSIETLFLILIVASLVLGFLLGVFREWELSMAVASARQGALTFEAQHPQYALSKITVNDAQNVTLLAAVFIPAVDQTDAVFQELRALMINDVQKSLAPQGSVQNNCVTSLLRNYCV